VGPPACTACRCGGSRSSACTSAAASAPALSCVVRWALWSLSNPCSGAAHCQPALAKRAAPGAAQASQPPPRPATTAALRPSTHHTRPNHARPPSRRHACDVGAGAAGAAGLPPPKPGGPEARGHRCTWLRPAAAGTRNCQAPGSRARPHDVSWNQFWRFCSPGRHPRSLLISPPNPPTHRTIHPHKKTRPPLPPGPRLDSVFLVFEYCPHDLGRLVDALPQPFHESEVKCLMQQVGGWVGKVGARDGGGPPPPRQLRGMSGVRSNTQRAPASTLFVTRGAGTCSRGPAAPAAAAAAAAAAAHSPAALHPRCPASVGGWLPARPLGDAPRLEALQPALHAQGRPTAFLLSASPSVALFIVYWFWSRVVFVWSRVGWLRNADGRKARARRLCGWPEEQAGAAFCV
jgi:hypothetical protein